MTFQQLASAEFQIATGTETITVENVPFTWDASKTSRDEQATYAVALYIGENKLTDGKPVTLRWVSSSKA